MDFNNTGAMRSPFSPRVRQTLSGRRPIGLSSAKKNPNKYNQAAEEQGGDVIYKTPLITLETYGAPLPVMVTEALTFGVGEVSVGMSGCGWCWAVCGRRVLAWARAAGEGGPAPARELTLPQTDLAHKADLVTIFYEDGAQMPSCIGVSPEGVVRYWASVGQEGAYVDASCELAGQECERLAAPPAHAHAHAPPPIVLATTTCTLVLITATTLEGRPTVCCRTLRPPSGWLGGIGRRVSLLFFGSMPAHADTKLVGAVVLGAGGLEAEGAGCVALVAGGAGGAGPVLQVWRGADLHEHSLRRALCDAFARHHPPHHAGEPSGLEIAAIEVRAGGDSGLLLLIAAVNVARSPELRYAIAHISLEEPTSPRVTSLLPLRCWPPDTEEPPRFLPLPTHVLLYTSKHIALLSSGGSMGDKAEYVDVSAEGDRILGGELCDGALVFSARHGPLRLAPPPAARDNYPAARSMCASPVGSPCASDMYDGNLSLYEIDPHEISAVTTDACGKLKAAFLFHLRRDTAACRDIVNALFPPPPATPTPAPDDDDVDRVLDRTVLTIATEMLDDMPAGDPRWKGGGGGSGAGAGAGGSVRVALGSSAALQVTAQLLDKKRAFTLFLDFLRATHLYRRLHDVTAGGGVVRTEAALRALAERLAAAVALRQLQQGADAHLIDAAILQVVSGGGGGGASWEGEGECEEEPEVVSALDGGALSASDVFYRRVSRAWRVVRALCAARAHAAVPPHRRAAHAHALATVLNTVLSEMQKTRTQWGSSAPPPPQPTRTLLPALLEFQIAAVTECARGCPDASARAQVLESAATLCALLLTEAAPLRHLHRYATMRRDAIRPFFEEGQLERAAALAERFHDLELLVEMCVAAHDTERLYSYIDKYINDGMCELTLSWLAQRGGAHARLAVAGVGARHAARMREWARAPARAELAAAHHLHAREYARAATRLARRAGEETASVERMITMASMAKLCLLAGGEGGEGAEGEEWQRVERVLALGEQHGALPRDVRVHYGLHAADTPVLPPEQLVQMYVDCSSSALTEYDYKKALDLTDFVQDMERRDELRLRVWCACVRRDSWDACDTQAPQREMHTKTFFRLLDLVQLMGGDVELLLPPLEDILTAPELAELVSDPRVHFMLKYGYECIDAEPLERRSPASPRSPRSPRSPHSPHSPAEEHMQCV